MKTINLVLLLSTLLLNTACDLNGGSSNGSGSTNTLKQLKDLSVEMDHLNQACPTLEGQYVTITERNEYGEVMSDILFYAKNTEISDVATELTVEDGDKLLINGEMQEMNFDGKTLNYIGACSNGRLRLLVSGPKLFVDTTYETMGETLYYTSKGSMGSERFNESYEAQLDNDYN